jgi:hypothetical protein
LTAKIRRFFCPVNVAQSTRVEKSGWIDRNADGLQVNITAIELEERKQLITETVRTGEAAMVYLQKCNQQHG